jgi:hypothetical protein
MDARRTSNWSRGSQLLFVVAALAAATLGACGGGSSETTQPPRPAPISKRQGEIFRTLDEVQTGVATPAAARQVCRRRFTERFVRSVQASSKASCADRLQANAIPPKRPLAIEAGSIRVGETRASAVVRGGDGSTVRVFFVRRGHGWSIDRVAPLARGG